MSGVQPCPHLQGGRSPSAQQFLRISSIYAYTLRRTTVKFGVVTYDKGRVLRGQHAASAFAQCVARFVSDSRVSCSLVSSPTCRSRSSLKFHLTDTTDDIIASPSALSNYRPSRRGRRRGSARVRPLTMGTRRRRLQGRWHGVAARTEARFVSSSALPSRRLISLRQDVIMRSICVSALNCCRPDEPKRCEKQSPLVQCVR